MNIQKAVYTEHRDAQGRLIDAHTHEPNSITQAFANMLEVQFDQDVADVQVTDITGTDRTLESSQFTFGSTQTAVNDPGIAFGTGTASVAYDDNDLANRLTTDVSYSNPNTTITQQSDATSLEVERTMSNDGASTITVTEAGHLAEAYDGTDNRVMLIARDLLDNNVDLDPNESLLGRYTWNF